MKCLGAQWTEALYEHLTNNLHVTVNGFPHAGIFTALGCWIMTLNWLTMVKRVHNLIMI